MYLQHFLLASEEKGELTCSNFFFFLSLVLFYFLSYSIKYRNVILNKYIFI